MAKQHFNEQQYKAKWDRDPHEVNGRYFWTLEDQDGNFYDLSHYKDLDRWEIFGEELFALVGLPIGDVIINRGHELWVN